MNLALESVSASDRNSCTSSGAAETELKVRCQIMVDNHAINVACQCWGCRMSGGRHLVFCASLRFLSFAECGPESQLITI
jgi:hypothetical protein